MCVQTTYIYIYAICVIYICYIYIYINQIKKNVCMCKKIAKLLIIKLNEQDLIKKLYISFFFQQFDIVEKIIRFIELLLFIISGVTSTVKY